VADAQIGAVNAAFTCKNQVQGSDAKTLNTPANYASIAALKARLQVIDADTYTDEVLNTMTVNDLVYAVRLNDDSGTI
jgi:hypothetical protein